MRACQMIAAIASDNGGLDYYGILDVAPAPIITF
jgi:hypothetical protein